MRPALVPDAVRHDRPHVSATGRRRASTVSLPRSRDQRARVTSMSGSGVESRQRLPGRGLICYRGCAFKDRRRDNA